jgi:hypothetical protein
MCLATLVNLLHKPQWAAQKQKNAELMISHKVLPYVDLTVLYDGSDTIDIQFVNFEDIMALVDHITKMGVFNKPQPNELSVAQ